MNYFMMGLLVTILFVMAFAFMYAAEKEAHKAEPYKTDWSKIVPPDKKPGPFDD